MVRARRGGDFVNEDLTLEMLQKVLMKPDNEKSIKEPVFDTMRKELDVSPMASDAAMTMICYVMLTEPNVYGLDKSKRLMEAFDEAIAMKVAAKDDSGELNDDLLFDVTNAADRYTFIDKTGMPRVYNKEAVRKLESNRLPATEHSNEPIYFPSSVKVGTEVREKKSTLRMESPMEMENEFRNIRTMRQQARRRGMAPVVEDEEYGIPTRMWRSDDIESTM